MGIPILAGLLFFLVVAGVLIYIVILYNELVRLRNDNDRAWANIDVLLKQRHDEIPNLVECVKGYMQHEQQTLLAVTQARTALMSAGSVGQKAQADLLLTGALRGLFADRREFFNDDVNTYNTRMRQIPEVFLASLMNLKPREFFKVSDEDRRQIEVSFAKSQGTAG